MMSQKQLNAFELKQFVLQILENYNSNNNLDDFELVCEILDNQNNDKLITKILLKELETSDVQKACVICSMLMRYNEIDFLIEKFWEILKIPGLNLQVKVQLINFIRDNDLNWSYEVCEEQLGDSTEILDENTRQMLENSVANPELQIDFLDFITNLSTDDKMALLHSFEEDFSNEGLSNVLMFLILSKPQSSVGKLALELLTKTKSPLAMHALIQLKNTVTNEEILRKVKKTINELKLQGITEDKTKEFYKNLLSDSVLGKFYITYPDGHGNIALIFTRITKTNKVRFVSIVANIDSGIKDCFGFYEISQFEADKIYERFFKNEISISLTAEAFRALLNHLEKNNSFEHYEYLCWKTLLADIDIQTDDIETFVQDNLSQNPNATGDDIFETDFCQRWYLDENYNDEFKNCLKDLQNYDNLDLFTDDKLNIVFDDETDMSEQSRLFIGAFIKLSLNNISEANNLYTLLKNKNLRYNLYKQIFKRSIYEYLTLIKYNSERNINNFSHEMIINKIKFIEENWCTK